MRKDVKLGFAIGGVLLAVLIVYVLVVPGGGDKRLATTDGAKSGDGKGVSLEPVTPAHPATQPTPGGGGSVAGGPPTAPPQNFTPPAGGGTDPFVEQPSGGDAVASKTKDVDWSKLLNDSQMLMVTPDKSAGAATPAGKPANQTALAGTPDITKPGPTPMAPPPPSQTKHASPVPPAHAEPAAAPSHTNEVADAKGGTPLPPPATPIIEPSAPTPPTPPVTPEPASSAKITTTTDAHGQQIHVVASGETFSTISLSAYGNPNLYAAIMRANPGVEPTKLRPGMKIVIPPAPEAKPAAATAITPSAAPSRASVSTDAAQPSSTKVDAPIDPQTQYRVQPGDSLYSIAKKLYGRGDRYVKLHEANRQLLGDDVNAVKSGQILTLPEPPTKQQQ